MLWDAVKHGPVSPFQHGCINLREKLFLNNDVLRGWPILGNCYNCDQRGIVGCNGGACNCKVSI